MKFQLYFFPILSCLHLVSSLLTSQYRSQVYTQNAYKSNRFLQMNKDDTLSLDKIASSWKIATYGQNGIIGLECIDPKIAEDTYSIQMSRKGGLGLDLIELNTGKGNSGLVVINEVIPGSNADKMKVFKSGDTLISISAVNNPENLSRLEGLNFDATISELSRFSEIDDIVITARRLVRRNPVIVRLYGPDGAYFTNFTVLSGNGANLRGILLSRDIKLYDTRTGRFDSPYQTGDCGGEGSCGTCMVQITQGMNLLNEKKRTEDMALKKQLAPPNYRWACRTRIAPKPEHSGVVHVKLRPQTASW